MLNKQRKAFTMIELTFVIVVTGILAAVAVPKLAATRDDAVITVVIDTISSVRSAIATERQKRTLRGNFDPIKTLNADASTTNTFTYFDTDKKNPVLEYSLKRGTTKSGWVTDDTGATGATGASNVIYTFYLTATNKCEMELKDNHFNPKTTPTTGLCKEMGL